MSEKKRFKKLQEGESYECSVLVMDMEDKKTVSRGFEKNYVRLSLSDGREIIQVNYFGITRADIERLGVLEGSVADVIICRTNAYLNVVSIRPVQGKELSKEDFIQSAPEEPERIFNEIYETIERTSHNEEFNMLSQLTIGMMDIYKSALIKAPAGKIIHHNMKGGLLFHTVRMLRSAELMCDVYENLDRELMLCSCVLHDIGKVRELSIDDLGNIDYTSEGRLLGHTALGMLMVSEYVSSMPDYDGERLKLVLHMIASHHGKKEYGAVADPAIPEAVCLHALDMQDCRIYQMEDQYKNIGPGEQSKKIYGLGNVTVYKPAD